MDKTWMSVPTYKWRDTGPHRGEEDCALGGQDKTCTQHSMQNGSMYLSVSTRTNRQIWSSCAKESGCTGDDSGQGYRHHILRSAKLTKPAKLFLETE